MAIDYKRFIKEFLKANRLKASNVHDKEVDEIFKAFHESLPAGISISKRMFLKHIRTVINVDTKPGYKYIKTGDYKTITKFVEVKRHKSLKQLGFTAHHNDQLERYQLENAVQIQIDKHNGTIDLHTSGFTLTVEILEAIKREALKYGEQD